MLLTQVINLSRTFWKYFCLCSFPTIVSAVYTAVKNHHTKINKNQYTTDVVRTIAQLYSCKYRRICSLDCISWAVSGRPKELRVAVDGSKNHSKTERAPTATVFILRSVRALDTLSSPLFSQKFKTKVRTATPTNAGPNTDRKSDSANITDNSLGNYRAIFVAF